MKLSQLPSHHAVLLTSNERKAYGFALWEELQSLSPAHRFFDQTVLDIETAREIISWAATPYNEKKIALISFHTAGIPAQNALLKVLEEPRTGVSFILLTSNKENLVDTVLSRVHHIPISSNNSDTMEAEIFFETAPEERMSLPCIVTLLAKKDEEDRKDREALRVFIFSLVEKGREISLEPRYMVELLEVASYVSIPSSSGKALLEYLSLLLPQTKV